jgi:PAS domain S-box-containing protein
MRLRLIAPVLLVLVVTAGAFVLVRLDTQRDANRDAENRASIAATDVRNSLEQASNLVESLRRFMLGPTSPVITNRQFADIGARSLSPVGLPAAAWVQMRAGALRTTLVTGASPMTVPGLDLNRQNALTTVVAEERTLFRSTATSLARVSDGRIGLFLVQSAPRLERGVLQPGYVVLFIPASWLLTAIASHTQEASANLQLRVGGTSYGVVGDSHGVGSSFVANGRRVDIIVPRKPIGSAAAALQWLVLGGGVLLAAVVGFLGVVRERRMQAQHEVDRFFRLSPDLITVAGFDGFWKRVNPALESLLGYTEREALGRPFLEFVHPDDRDRTAEEVRSVLGGATTFAFLNRMVCKDGSHRWIEWTATSVPGEGLLYGVGRDVTDRRRTDTQELALRRIATLAAEGVRPAELFSVVAEEVARVVDVPLMRVMRYEDENTATEFASFSKEGRDIPFGRRSSLEGTNVLRLVWETSRAARIDDFSELEGEIAEIVRSQGIQSAVGSPIVVAGRLWGAMVASSTELLPEGIEQRLAEFTELLAGAIGNAESREGIERLAAEQAALRRVATLVARGAPSDELFASVVEEVGRLLPVRSAAMGRYESDDRFATVAAWSASDVAFPIGGRWAPEGNNITANVFRTGRSARMDDFSAASGPIGERAKEAGYRSAVGSPITVEGRLWGVLSAASTAEEPLPPDTEASLARFTELVSTSIARAESRDALARLADEQAALRRVATLVAEGASQSEIFDLAAREVAKVFGVSMVSIDRYDSDSSSIVLASVNQPLLRVGSHWPHDGPSIGANVLRTGRPARIDDYGPLDSTAAARMREMSITSAVGIPIEVDSRPWGYVSIGTGEDPPLPKGIEARLANFTELLSAAIARAESRDALALLADEQAALRRLATLVAKGVPPAQIFSAVSQEVGQLFGSEVASVLKFEDDGGPPIVFVGVSKNVEEVIAVGTRRGLDEGLVSAQVYRTGRSARVDGTDWARADKAVAEAGSRLGVASTVASPIHVEGRLWGAATVSAGEPLPADAEERLSKFAEIVATAIASAEARAQVERLAEEQAALRRVAILVAHGASPSAVLDLVAGEMERLLGADGVTLSRYEPDQEVVVVAHSGSDPRRVPAGTRVSHLGENVTSFVRRTERPARLEHQPGSLTALAELVGESRVRASVGAPIVVEGRLWGVAIANWRGGESPPPDTEARMAQFAQLVETAIANAESREALAQLADEQAALRRVATLIAQGAPPGEIFAAVSDEVAQLLDTLTAGVVKFDEGERAIVMVGAAAEVAADFAGGRWSFDDPLAAAEVYRTGRSARTGGTYWGSLDDSARFARVGILSAVASPIVVEGRLWGAVVVAGAEELPRDTEERLEQFTDLVATAIANAQGKSELEASRRRIVAASDEARRRIERDIHDGAQQRLVALGLALRAAEADIPAEREDLRTEVSRVAIGLADAVEDLQELSRGIHPTILSKGGLAPALRTLAHRSPIPVALEVGTEVRLPEPIEVAAYYVVSEALANAAKHAHASRVDVSLATRNGNLLLTVRDDGIGGADHTRGSGLVGLNDRVEALGGSLRVKSAAGDGTRITAELPLQLEPASA